MDQVEILKKNAKKLEEMNKNNPLWNVLKTVDSILRTLRNMEE